MSKMAWEHAKRMMNAELMNMEIKELEELKRECFKQWDRVGAIITLKTMEGEE